MVDLSNLGGIVVNIKDIDPAEVTDDVAYDELSNYFDGHSDTIPEAVRDYVCAQWLEEQTLDPSSRAYKHNLILEAVRYIAWCKAELIDDSKPKVTVRNCYGLDDIDPVKKWVTRYSTPTPPEHPSFIATDLVRTGMQIAGEHYKHCK